MKKAIAAALVLSTLATAGCQTTGKTQGQKDIEKLTVAIESLNTAVKKSKADLELTLAAHDSVIAAQGDLAKLYGEFSKSLDKCKKNEAALAKQTEAIKAAAAVRFAQWEKDIAAIGSEDLKKRGEKQLAETKKKCDAVVELGEKGRAAYVPLMTTLNDHATYWASNLSPSAAQSLSKDSASVQKNAKTVYEVLDKVVAAATGYTEAAAMKVEPAPTQPAEASKKAK
jgi:hypothetical protein